MSGTTHPVTQHHIQGDLNLLQQQCEKLKYYCPWNILLLPHGHTISWHDCDNFTTPVWYIIGSLLFIFHLCGWWQQEAVTEGDGGPHCCCLTGRANKCLLIIFFLSLTSCYVLMVDVIAALDRIQWHTHILGRTSLDKELAHHRDL